MMPAHHRVLRLILAVILATVVVGCGRDVETGINTPLRIAFVPQVDMEERHQAAYEALRDYLSPRLGRPVEIVQLENANAALEGLRSGKLDVCNFSPWPFLLAENKAGLEALLLTQAPDGRPVHYRGILVTHPGTGLTGPDDLKERAGELVFAFEEPVSTSGHLVPRTFLHSMDIVPEKHFKKVLYGSDGVANLFAVASRRIDLAALSDSSLRRAVAKGRLREGDVTVVWTSEPVLSNVTAARAALPTEVKRHLTNLLIDLPRADPVRWEEVARQYSNPVAGYMTVQSDSLDYFRKAIRDVPGLQFGP